MKAVLINNFGSAKELVLNNDVPKPRPYSNQVLIKVKATSVNALDWKTRKGELKIILGSKFPMVLGNDVAGEIVECGKQVKQFKVGDQVFAMLDSNRKFAYSGFATPGAYAQYAVTREDTLAIKPSNVNFEEAASIPLSCLTAYQVLNYKVKLKKGDHILINGASGAVGVYAVQLAKIMGAKITAVCSSKNVDAVKLLGANCVIDYTKENIVELQDRFDVIYDVIANRKAKDLKHLLSKNGLFVSNLAHPIFVLFPFLRRFKKFGHYSFAWVKPSGTDLENIRKLIEQNQLKPIVNNIFPLDKIQTAHDYSEKGKAFGKVVITV